MSSTYKMKEKMQPVPMTDVLNQLLANTIDFRLMLKQAHWNTRGPNFIALHELFDKASAAVDEYADMLAERVVQLDGTARGDLQTVSCQSHLFDYPVELHDSGEYVKVLSSFMELLAGSSRQAIDTANAAGDMVTADILTEVTRGLDKYHWYIRAHIPKA